MLLIACRLVMAMHEHQEFVAGLHVFPQSSANTDWFSFVTASTAGDVRFWDSRQARSVRAIQAEPGCLTSFAVHSIAPVFAT